MKENRKKIYILLLALMGVGFATHAFAATQIFRSVGPSATGSLADGSASNAMTISSTTATFSAPLSVATVL